MSEQLRDKSDDKNQLDYRLNKLLISHENTKEICRTITRLAKYGVILGCCWLALQGLKELTGLPLDTLLPLKNLIEAINLERIIWAAVALLTSTGYYIERQRNRRAIKVLGNQRQELEKADPSRIGTNLTADGRTPKDRP